MKVNICLIILVTALFGHTVSAQPNQKNRVVILSDIEAEPDDLESFVRLLLYSNVIDLKGLIATTSVWKKQA